MTRQTRYGSLYERLVANTHEPEGVHGCWLWKGAVGGSGYGRVNQRVGGKHKALDAHRVMAEVLLGRSLGKEEQSDHLCFNPACIAPDHIEVVHYLVNLARRRRGPLTYAVQHVPAKPGVDLLQMTADRAWDARRRPVKRCPF